ncbi:SCO2525 family SAM-dependent methyltransferase [Yinghuangia aomiensis]|uniref:SCO2525 family SAM-dependent methyltransferase n=1 Tax=Yinghuangia aomiensis TaxID=676205 RepID=A0ABP9HTU0_9ACTN
MYSNADTDWDAFDPAQYMAHNYLSLTPDDRRLLALTRDRFATADLPMDARGLDVGSGSNLYPALAMLPHCREITLWEYGAGNVDWLRTEVADYSPHWDACWAILAEAAPYRRVGAPRTALAERARVVHGSVYDLPATQWDLGTMFFVAESMSELFDEFLAAVDAFTAALKPGAPFVAAFMENSEGYAVGDRPFPAVGIDSGTVHAAFAPAADELVVERIAPMGEKLRDGYTGMLLAVGRIRAERGTDPC